MVQQRFDDEGRPHRLLKPASEVGAGPHESPAIPRGWLGEAVVVLADDQLAAQWWNYHRLSRGSRDERKALETGEPADAVEAADIVYERVAQGGSAALSTVASLVRTAVSADDLCLVGAGPLEDLLCEHGVELAQSVDELARREPAFAAALRCVWWSPPDRDTERLLGRWLGDRT